MLFVIAPSLEHNSTPSSACANSSCARPASSSHVAAARSPRAGPANSTTSRPPAAADALIAILRKLHTYRGDSRFTTWAYKFALLEAAVRVRRRAWQDAESRSTKTAGHSLPTAAPYPKPTPKRPS